MRILSISDHPIHQIPYIAAASGGGMIEKYLPVLSGEVDCLPPGLEAMIVTSDLQGLDPKNQRLLGHLVVEELEGLAAQKKIPSPSQTGVILAGDLYAQMNKRGGQGDVRLVWQAFSQCFRFVAGVAGNHDNFGNDPKEFQEFQKRQGIHYLDGRIAAIGNFRIAGISGIIGKIGKPFRRSQKEFTRTIKLLVEESPDILVLHQGPSNPEANLLGDESVRVELMSASDVLVICGHCYWKTPVTILPEGLQVLNVDSRVVVLKPISGTMQSVAI